MKYPGPPTVLQPSLSRIELWSEGAPTDILDDSLPAYATHPQPPLLIKRSAQVTTDKPPN